MADKLRSEVKKRGNAKKTTKKRQYGMTRREALRKHDLGELVKLGAVSPEYLQEVEAYDYYKTKAREWKPGKPKPSMEVVKRYRIPSERMRGIVRRMEDEGWERRRTRKPGAKAARYKDWKPG